MEKQLITLKEITYEGYVENNRFIVNGEPLMGNFSIGLKKHTDYLKVTLQPSGAVSFDGAESLRYATLNKVIVAKKKTNRTISHKFSETLSPMAQKVLEVLTTDWQLTSEVATKAGVTIDQLKGVLSKLNNLGKIELQKGKYQTRYVKIIV